MKEKERYFYTVHDELFFDLIIPHGPLKAKERRAEVSLTEESLPFTVHELVLWTILVDYKLKNPYDLSISLSYIHKQYRGKRTGKTDVMSKADLEAYTNALNGLQKKRVNVKTGNTRPRYLQNNKELHNERIFKITNITGSVNGDIDFEYTLGKYGEIIARCKRYSDMVPMNLLKIPYKQNMKLYIAMYISRLIFINRRKGKKDFVVTVESIMKNIRLHDADGIYTGKTLFDLTNENSISKYSKIKLFYEYLTEVLELLKLKESIYDYDMSLEDGWKCHIDIKSPQLN